LDPEARTVVKLFIMLDVGISNFEQCAALCHCHTLPVPSGPVPAAPGLSTKCNDVAGSRSTVCIRARYSCTCCSAQPPNTVPHEAPTFCALLRAIIIDHVMRYTTRYRLRSRAGEGP
jgi:hypothetical protein